MFLDLNLRCKELVFAKIFSWRKGLDIRHDKTVFVEEHSKISMQIGKKKLIQPSTVVHRKIEKQN